MGASTQYDVNIMYVLQDKASSGMRALDTATRENVASANTLTESLRRLGAMVAGAFGIHQAKKALIDFNSEMEQSQITVAGMLQMNLGGEWSENIGRATDMVKRLQKESLTSTATTKEMYEMLTMIVQPLSRAGFSMEQMTKTTGSMVVMSKALNMPPQQAAIEMQELMNGMFTNRNRFGIALLGNKEMGYDGEGGRGKFTHLSEAKRAQELARALNSKTAGEMKAAQTHTFMGEMSTFEDRLQLALGAVGLPLFKAITAEIRSWNAWIDQNGAALADFGARTGASLVSAFHVLRDTVAFFVEHKGVIMAIAATWGSLKLSGMAGGAISGIFGEAASLQKAFGALAGAEGVAGAAAGMGALSLKLASATTAVGLLAVAAVGFYEWWKNQSAQGEAGAKLSLEAGPALEKNFIEARRMAQAGAMGPMRPGDPAVRNLWQQMKDAGLATDSGIDHSKMSNMFEMNDDLRQKFYTLLDVKDHSDIESFTSASYAGEFLAKRLEEAIAKLGGTIEQTKDFKKLPQGPDKPKVNVTIHRIEVASDDPDRFAFRMVQTFREVARNPGQARRTLRQL